MANADNDALIRAMGGALGIIGALLERADVATLNEFAGALRVYATVTRETDAAESEIVGQWAVALLDLAARQHNSN